MGYISACVESKDHGFIAKKIGHTCALSRVIVSDFEDGWWSAYLGLLLVLHEVVVVRVVVATDAIVGHLGQLGLIAQRVRFQAGDEADAPRQSRQHRVHLLGQPGRFRCSHVADLVAGAAALHHRPRQLRRKKTRNGPVFLSHYLNYEGTGNICLTSTICRYFWFRCSELFHRNSKLAGTVTLLPSVSVPHGSSH